MQQACLLFWIAIVAHVLHLYCIQFCLFGWTVLLSLCARCVVGKLQKLHGNQSDNQYSQLTTKRTHQNITTTAALHIEYLFSYTVFVFFVLLFVVRCSVWSYVVYTMDVLWQQNFVQLFASLYCIQFSSNSMCSTEKNKSDLIILHDLLNAFFRLLSLFFYPYFYVGFFLCVFMCFFLFISSSMLVMLVFRFSIETMHNFPMLLFFQCSFVSFVHLRTVPFLQLIFFYVFLSAH